jgi:hypothetical protein
MMLILLHLLLMDFLPHGSHLFKVFVDERSCPSLIDYGLIVSKKRHAYCPRTYCINPGMKELKNLYPI